MNLRSIWFELFLLHLTSSTCPNNTIPWTDDFCKPIDDAVNDATNFLLENMPNFDKPNTGTLFDGGIAIPTVNISLMARQKYPWAGNIPIEIYFDYVLPYASVNEARTNWRQLLWNKLSPEIDVLLYNYKTNQNGILEVVARFVNSKIWSLLAPSNVDSITFKSQQTPMIYDPMSTMIFGYASCTGISLLYIDALRTFGVPARLVGTPAWNGNVELGNHNWVEVWLGKDVSEGWKFIEGLPAGGSSETFDDPCDKWFCTESHFDKNRTTKVFAARFSKSEIHYPMAWDLENWYIPGVDRTEYYQQNCKSCSNNNPTIDVIS